MEGAAEERGVAQQQQQAQQQVQPQSTGGIVITGTLAVMCIGSFVVVMLGIAFYVYRNYYQPRRGVGRNPYTLVTKSGDV